MGKQYAYCPTGYVRYVEKRTENYPDEENPITHFVHPSLLPMYRLIPESQNNQVQPLWIWDEEQQLFREPELYEEVDGSIYLGSLDIKQAMYDIGQENAVLANENTVLHTAVQLTAMAYTDDQALLVKMVYPEWAALPDGTPLTKQEEATKGTEITKVLGPDGNLYKVITTHKKQADWIPGRERASLFTIIEETHSGTLDDPIPARANMEYVKGKYYMEDGKVYLMNREGMEEGESITLQYPPSQLVGQYFELVEG